MKFANKMLMAGLLTACSFGLTQTANALPPGATEVGTPGGGGVSVSSDTVWSGVVVLRDNVFVENGASLTIEAGTVIITFITEADDAGVVVTRDAQLFVLGTKDEPVIATSARDVATWTGTTFAGPASAPTDISVVGDSKTGTWALAATEWRNFSILGNGIISASSSNNSSGAANPAFPDTGSFAEARMEGLTTFSTDRTFYGGLNDMDDSGTIRYFSSRYGGRVTGLGVELNGISLGGLGKETELEYIEIMNNTDDGIEIWGGTADIKHFAVWNVGDDSFDFDQGWRGRAQFGLIVQGASLQAGQGSGVGDNCIEFDGAELAEANPRSSTALYNITVVGNPANYGNIANGLPTGGFSANTGIVGDGATAWRDNARAQFRRCIFMDIGDELVRYDDDENGNGYGGTGNITQNWQDVWTTTVSGDPVADGTEGVNISNNAPFTAADLYSYNSQLTSPGGQGMLAEIRDSVVFNLNGGNLYDNTNAGTPGNDDYDPSTELVSAAYANRIDNLTTPAVSGAPIQALTREAPNGAVNGNVPRVTFIDPRPAFDALTVRDAALDTPLGDFWSPFKWTGAFSPDNNWADNWTAADAYGFFPVDFVSDQPDNVTIQIAVTQTSFVADAAKCYVVLCSTDGRDWTPVAEISNRSGLVTVAQEISVDENKIYKVVIQ